MGKRHFCHQKGQKTTLLSTTSKKTTLLSNKVHFCHSKGHFCQQKDTSVNEATLMSIIFKKSISMLMPVTNVSSVIAKVISAFVLLYFPLWWNKADLKFDEFSRDHGLTKYFSWSNLNHRRSRQILKIPKQLKTLWCYISVSSMYDITFPSVLNYDIRNR